MDKDPYVKEFGDETREYRSLYSGEISTLNYLIASNLNELGIAANVVDSLIEYDKYGIIRPALATSWEISPDNKVWTFKIREGVKWLRADGREYDELTADDFVAAMEYVLQSSNKSLTANIVYSVIKNAESYYNGEIKDFTQVGVKAKERYILEYTLEEPVPYFLSMMTYSCFFPANRRFINEVGKEFGKDNLNLLYNGAYILKTFEPQNKRILEKNYKYWDQDNVYIEKISAKYNKESGNLAPEMFMRGEIDNAAIPSSVLNQWVGEKERDNMIRPIRNSFFTYFYAFNFEPNYPDEYEPENWEKAVNNINFRKSIFHGLDRLAAILTSEPYKPEAMIQNTITPKNFINYKGQDYTRIGELLDIVDRDSFDKDLALKYKENSIVELKGHVKFPIIIVMPYNTSSREWANRAQVIKQQLEGLLGSDYININIVPNPPTGFLQKVRRSGNFSLMECNWGPDYADPQTYTDPFVREGSFNRPYLAEEYLDKGGVSLYEKMVEEGKEELYSVQKRYELFAKAEAFLIKEALVIPYCVGGGGYVASRLNPFLSSYSHFGISTLKFKGQKLLQEPMNSKDFQRELVRWEEEREKVLN